MSERRSSSAGRTSGRKALQAGDVLIILDMINAFQFDDGQALSKRALGIVGPLRRLRDAFDAKALPVIYVNDNFTQWTADFRELVVACAHSDGPSARIATELAPLPGHHHVLKPKHSGFFNTPLPLLLECLGTKRVVLTGIATDACVAATGLDAKMRDLDAWVPEDCTNAVSMRQKRLGLMWIGETLKFSTDAFEPKDAQVKKQISRGARRS